MCNAFVGRRSVSLFLLALAAVVVVAGCQQDRVSTTAGQTLPDDPEFQAGADRKPTARTLYAMARILEKKGEDADQRRVLMRIINEYPRFLPAYNDLAKAYMRQGAHNHAAQTLLAGLLVSPRDPVLLNNLGMCWLNKGDYDTALECFQKAAAAVPSAVQYRSNMAVALGMLGRYEESLALFRQVLPAEEAHYNVAVLCEARNEPELAARYRDRAGDLAATGSDGASDR